MSQAVPKCEYSDYRNIGITTYQCTVCEKYFCDEHKEALIATYYKDALTAHTFHHPGYKSIPITYNVFVD